MTEIILGGKPFVIYEPVFKDLKNIIAALNRLNNKEAHDLQIVNDVQLILVSLLGDDNVRKFKRYCWEAWKIPAPTPEELTALFAEIPALCGLQPASSSTTSTSDTATDWDALYWQIIRLTGWSWENVGNSMTLSRLASMQESLNVSPSTDSLVAAYLGYEYTKPQTLENKIDAWLASQGKDNG
jgi:hypothetical protein